MRPPSLLPSALVLFFVLLSLLSLSPLSSAGVPKNAMLLQDVSTLVFTKGDKTNARRSSPVPQMSCKSGPCQYAPATAMCRNAGFDGVDVTWKCEADLPKGVKFSAVEVSCEGYANRDDEYVLKGSCGLEYGLQGEPQYESEEREEDSWVNRNIKHNAGQKVHDKVHDTTAYPRHSEPSYPPSSSLLSSLWALSPLSWLSSLTDNSHSQYEQSKSYPHRQYDRSADSSHYAGSQHPMGVLGFFVMLASHLFSLAVKGIAVLVILYVIYKIMRPSTSVPAPPQRTSPGLFRSLLGALPFSSLLGGGTQSHSSYTAPPPYPGHDAPGYSPNAYDKSYTRPPPTSAAQQAGSGYSVLHGLVGGSLLGYLTGRWRGSSETRTAERRAAAAAAAAASAEQSRQYERASQSYRNAPPVNPEYVRRGGSTYESTTTTEVPDVRTTETSTAYARTKRR